MTMNVLRSRASVTATIWLAALGACRGAPPPPPTPPPALSAHGAAALRWVNANTGGFTLTDSMNVDRDRRALAPIVNGARVLGVSELTEGTNEFPDIVRRTLFALADSGFRGVAIQGPMPEALELDRWVRTSQGDPRRIMRQLGSWRWDSREMWAFMLALRTWNEAHKADGRQIGFYGFEIPTAARAVEVVTSLPDSVAGVALNQWLKRTYTCVATNEAAQWGREGRAADSSFWNACGPATAAATDSIAALRSRYSPTAPVMPGIVFAESMARLIRHHVNVGLRHLSRHEANAAHVLYVLDELGPGAKLLVWGGDFEMGRLTDNRITQTGVPLGEKLGDKYRAAAFAIGGGTIRARVPSAGGRGGGGEPGYGTPRVAVPAAESYEDVLMRANHPNFWLDMRSLPSDSAGIWLHGPRQMRIITDIYTPLAPNAFETTVEFPKNYDAIIFARTVSPAHP